MQKAKSVNVFPQNDAREVQHVWAYLEGSFVQPSTRSTKTPFSKPR